MQLKPELVESLQRYGFTTATEVQERAIPMLLQGKSVMARAKSGTGKTAAFIVPILQSVTNSEDAEAIVITPTRELALQVADFAKQVGRPLGIGTVTVYGGASLNVQLHELQRNPKIVVGTPGRIIDLFDRGALRLSTIRYLVLDEVDVMLDMGFVEDVDYIVSKTPVSKQVMLFSATMPEEIARLAANYAGPDCVHVTVGQEEDITVSTIRHTYALVPRNLKFSALLAYIKQYNPGKTAIFARTQYEAENIHRVLTSQGYIALLIHGGLTQSKRERSLGGFRTGAKFLVATNVAARGIDVLDITDVINFDVPEDPRTYVHRVGRSARMGKQGRAFTIVAEDRMMDLVNVENYANVKIEQIKLDLEPYRSMHFAVSTRSRESGGFRGQGRRNFSGRRRGGGFSSLDRERFRGRRGRSFRPR